MKALITAALAILAAAPLAAETPLPPQQAPEQAEAIAAADAFFAALRSDDKTALAEIHYAQERGPKAGLDVLIEVLA